MMRLPGDLDPGFLNSLFEAVCILDLDQTVLFWNDTAEDITGFSSDLITGLKCIDSQIDPVDEDGHRFCASAGVSGEALDKGHEVRRRVFIMHTEGHRVPIMMKVIPIGSTENFQGTLVLFREDALLEELRERLRDLENLCLVDSLTGVPNRRHAERNIHSRLAEMERYGNMSAFFIIDVDCFSELNREFGHFSADRALRMVANSIIGTLRPFDLFARWRADQFIASVSGASLDIVSGIGERMRMIVSSSTLDTPGGKANVSVSIGGTLAQPGEEMEIIIGRLEGLLRKAGMTGGNRVVIG
jgi:diguanylate cyclase (GGDEF)-like protein/PAS domain S-box-containing protein